MRNSFQHSSLFHPKGAFTLLEIIVVLAILGFMVAMITPLVTTQVQSQSQNLTEENVENIYQAIVGPRDNLDEDGNPIPGGYVGDMGYLPKLYKCEFDPDAGIWRWDTEETIVLDDQNRPLNQPRGLWEAAWQDQVDAGSTDEEDLFQLGSWGGPYLPFPSDLYPNDTMHYDYYGGDADQVRACSTQGRLADGWGRAFYFYLDPGLSSTDERDDTLYIISEGKDLKSSWKSDGSYPVSASDIAVYDPEGHNADNIVITVSPYDWYHHNLQVKIDNTVEILETVRTAIVGPRNAFDEHGDRVIGGYVGDMGNLPVFYDNEWDSTTNKVIWDVTAYSDAAGDTRPWGQPRGLWKDTWEDEMAPVTGPLSLGGGWGGPYITTPRDPYPIDTMHHSWTEPADRDEIRMREVEGKLSDAWGRSLLFYRDDPGTTGTLWIVSEGRDRISKWKDGGTFLEPGTTVWENASENLDNIWLRITPNEWNAVE